MSVFSLSNLKKTWYYLEKNGIRNAVWAVLERSGQEQEVYTWQEPDEKTLSFQREHSASLRISIVVPAYRTKKEHLEAMLNSGCGRHGRVCTGLGKKERNLPAGSGRCIKSCRMEGLEHRALHPFLKQRNFRQYERRNWACGGRRGRSAGSRRSADCECALGDGGLSGKRKKARKTKACAVFR